MPERELGSAGETSAPPSLALLGLDPLPPAAFSGGFHGIEESDWRPNPLTPVSKVDGLPLPGLKIPPPPPAAKESPRGEPSLRSAAYTPGGTRTGVETVVPPVPPITLPPPVNTGLGVPGFHRMEEPTRLVYHLPQIAAEPRTQDASVAAGDWIARIKPVLTTLSPSAGQWWQETHRTAFVFYQRWLVGEPSERLAVRSEVEAHRADWAHLSLINERGAVLILGALTTELQTECVTTRSGRLISPGTFVARPSAENCGKRSIF